MKLIDKAWEINSTFNDDKRYETKEELIKYRCPKGDCFNLVKENDKELCNKDSPKACLQCWNQEFKGEINMKAIDKAWKENLQISKDCQYDTKEDIIKDNCPTGNSFYGVDLKSPKYCTDGDDENVCTRCWNREIEEDKQVNNNESESTFDKLHYSPIEFCFAPSTEEYLIESLKDNDAILYMRQDERLTYEQIPEIIKWMQDVYNYTTELKNKIEYVDFYTAKEYMEKDIYNKAQYGDYIYYIKDNELLCDDLYDACSLLLEAINSKKWILLY